MIKYLKNTVVVFGTLIILVTPMTGCTKDNHEESVDTVTVPKVVSKEALDVHKDVEIIENVTLQDYENIKIGTKESEIHQMFGEPTGSLSGFYGDIYVTEDKRIVVYYELDSDSEYAVTEIKIENRNDNDEN